MPAQVLVATETLSHDQWLDYRRKGVCGSDIAALLGFSKWGSPIKIYMDKIGELPPQEETEAIYWGNVLEDVVAKEFQRRTGLKVRKKNAMLQHPEHSWMLGNVDRLIIGKKEGLECKTTNAYLAHEWPEDKVPDQYFLQCQWYMAVTGFKKWHLAVLIGGNDFRIREIERDDELIEILIEKGKDFWFNHVLPKNPPELDGSKVSEELLNKMYPNSTPDSKIELPNKFESDLERYDELNSQINQLTEEKKAIENRIKNEMGDTESAVLNERRISWKSFSSSRFDSKGFKKDYPELFNKYMKISNSRRFQIK